MKKNLFLSVTTAALALTLASCGAGKGTGGTDGNDTQYIRAKGDTSKALVALNVVPGASSIPKSLGDLRDVFVLSCGYELKATDPDGAMVPPLNMFAHSTPVAQFHKSAKEIVGGGIMMFGTAAGVVLLASSMGDVNAESALNTAFGGVAAWLSSFFIGAPMLGSASQDNTLLIRRAAVFAAMTAGVHEKDPSFYESNKSIVKGSGNTPLPCSKQKASTLRLIMKTSH